MKKILFLLVLFITACLEECPVFATSQPTLEFALFVSPTCVHCNKLKREYWDKLQEKYKDKVHFTMYDITQDGNNLIFMDTAQAYGVDRKHVGYPAAAIGESFLMGYPTQIGTYAENAIEKALLLQEKTTVVLPVSGEEKAREAFSKITFLAIIGAGLIDGINPCAFAVIVFFVSFLSVYKYTRREIIIVGISYCFAVFLAYLLLGIGVFKFLYAMRGFSTVIQVFYWGTAALCLILFFLCVYDFVLYAKTKKADGMLLQLPLSLKTRIHKIMGFFLRDKSKSTFRLTLAALAVGFGVSLVEAVCTGQVYIPTCVLIMKDPSCRVQALSYLIIYNMMFIIPLVAVFVLTLLGYESKTFNALLKKHLGFTKICLCGIFLGLFILLLKTM